MNVSGVCGATPSATAARRAASAASSAASSWIREKSRPSADLLKPSRVRSSGSRSPMSRFGRRRISRSVCSYSRRLSRRSGTRPLACTSARSVCSTKAESAERSAARLSSGRSPASGGICRFATRSCMRANFSRMLVSERSVPRAGIASLPSAVSASWQSRQEDSRCESTCVAGTGASPGNAGAGHAASAAANTTTRCHAPLRFTAGPPSPCGPRESPPVRAARRRPRRDAARGP